MRFRDREAKERAHATANLGVKVLRVCLGEAVGTSSACIPNEYIRGIPSSGKYQQRLEVDV